MQVPLIEPVTPQQEVADETIPEDSAPLWFQEIQTSTEEPGWSDWETFIFSVKSPLYTPININNLHY